MPSPTSIENDTEMKMTFDDDPILTDGVGAGEPYAKHDEAVTFEAKDEQADDIAAEVETTDDTSTGGSGANDDDFIEHNDKVEGSTASATTEAKLKSDSSQISTHFQSEPNTLAKRNIKQYEYIKQGARIKSLLSTAFRVVADGWLGNEEGDRQSKKREVVEEDDEEKEEGANKKARGLKEAEDLARDKMEQCVILNRVRLIVYLFLFFACRC